MPQQNLVWVINKCAAYVFVLLMLGACSQLPDSINPVEWYNSSVDFFAAKDIETKANKPQKQGLHSVTANQKKDTDYPTIASVDQQRDYYEARKRGGLVADTKNREYAPSIARQGELATRIAAAPPPEPKPKDPAPAVKKTGLEAKIISSKSVSKEKVALTTSSLSKSSALVEQKNLQTRLQQRLNEIRVRAGQSPTELSTSIVSLRPRDDFGTVIVNSEGTSTEQFSMASRNLNYVKEQPLATSPSVKFGNLANQAKPTVDGAIKVATIHFGNGSAALSSRDRQIIANALQLKRERGGRIHIIGHASSRTRSLDPLRHKMLNFKISVDRADAVARELIRLGMNKEDLLVDAISDSQPMYFEFMPTGEAGNRRAEIYLEG